MEAVYVTSKGQLIIPAKIRQKLGIKPGTKICFVEREHEVLFQPLTKKYIRSLAGMLKSPTSATATLLGERKLDKKRANKTFDKRRPR